MIKKLLKRLLLPAAPFSEDRRTFLRGAGAALICAPAIVPIGSLMKLSAPRGNWIPRMWLDPTLDAQMFAVGLDSARMTGTSLWRFDGHGITDVTWASLPPEIQAGFTKELSADNYLPADDDEELRACDPFSPDYQPPGHAQRTLKFWDSPPNEWILPDERA